MNDLLCLEVFRILKGQQAVPLITLYSQVSCLYLCIFLVLVVNAFLELFLGWCLNMYPKFWCWQNSDKIRDLNGVVSCHLSSCVECTRLVVSKHEQGLYLTQNQLANKHLPGTGAHWNSNMLKAFATGDTWGYAGSTPIKDFNIFPDLIQFWWTLRDVYLYMSSRMSR